MGRQPLVILGAGGLGREIKTWVKDLPEFEFKGFIDDEILPGTVLDDASVIGPVSKLELFYRENLNIIVAIGNPTVKSALISALAAFNFLKYPVLVHPTAVLQDRKSISLGPGTVICAGCILTTGITIGTNVLINLHVTVGHDTNIGSASSIMPGVNISGQVNVGSRALLGTGSTILNRVNIGDDAIVGAGAVVLHDVPSNSTAVGVPARIIRQR